MIEHFHWSGKEQGLNLLITGGIHGNEICGIEALKWLKSKIDCNQITLRKGSLTIIPICNPKAYELDKRYYQRDLNRHFYPKEKPELYEDEICNHITPFFKKTDVLLDIHSYHSEGEAFLFFKPGNPKEEEFSGMLGVSTFFYGFASAYDKAGIQQSEDQSMGTTEYTRLHGGYGVTLECGYHKDPNAIDVAKRAVLGALFHLGMVEVSKNLENLIPARINALEGDFYEMQEVFFKRNEGDLLKIHHLAKLHKNEIIAEYKNRSKIKSPSDGYLIFPKEKTKIGDEWFYIAKKVA